MNMLHRRHRQSEAQPAAAVVNGEPVLCDPTGVVFVPDQHLLVVSDMHLEKGAAFARRGMMLPPYDTAETLTLLARAIERYAPRRVLCLGDSFHDRHGAALMPAHHRDVLNLLMVGREWIWVLGNHDPVPPAFLGGETGTEYAIGALVFRHEPTVDAAPGEMAGHLHPVAKVSGNGRSVRGACFATDGARMILPSFGVTTGGLNVLDRAFHGLFETAKAKAYVIGLTAIYPIAFAALSRA